LLAYDQMNSPLALLSASSRAYLDLTYSYAGQVLITLSTLAGLEPARPDWYICIGTQSQHVLRYSEKSQGLCVSSDSKAYNLNGPE